MKIIYDLIIRPHESERVIYFVLRDQRFDQMIEVPVRSDSWQFSLYAQLEQVCKKRNIDLVQIGAIYIKQGIGSFSVMRQAVSLANTLAWLMNIPIFEFDNLPPNKQNNKWHSAVSPRYSHKPNIANHK